MKIQWRQLPVSEDEMKRILGDIDDKIPKLYSNVTNKINAVKQIEKTINEKKAECDTWKTDIKGRIYFVEVIPEMRHDDCKCYELKGGR